MTTINRIYQIIVIVFLFELPSLAQNPPTLIAQPITSPLDGIHSAPIITDQNGNPNQPQSPTDTELANQRRQNERLSAQLRAITDDAARRAVDESNRMAAQLAKEQKSHDQNMIILYVGIALVAGGIITRIFFKRSQ